jgi:hypothetical protein
MRPGALAATLGAVVGLAAAATAGAQPAPAPAPQPLDLGALASQGKPIAVSEDLLRAALIKGKSDGAVFSNAIDLGGGAIAVAWSDCSRTDCRGFLATLTGGAAHPKLARQVALAAPVKVWVVDSFALETPVLADLDGDGAAELVLRYRASEPPRAALGALGHEYVAVHAPGDLAPIFSHELWRAGGGFEEACEWTLARSGDRLLVTGRCAERVCLESASPPADCKPGQTVVESWRRAPGQRAYARADSARPTPRK